MEVLMKSIKMKRKAIYDMATLFGRLLCISEIWKFHAPLTSIK